MSWGGKASPMYMLLVIGLLLVIVGYLILFSVPSNSSFERIFIQAILGMGISISGGIFLMLYIFRRSR